MRQMINLLNAQWAGKHVVINEGQEDFTVGVIKNIDWLLDEYTYTKPPRVRITFEEGSDIESGDYEIETLDIKLDSRYYS